MGLDARFAPVIVYREGGLAIKNTGILLHGWGNLWRADGPSPGSLFKNTEKLGDEGQHD